MSIYVIIGAPGAGKGTQADILAERLGVLHVASGDLFREAVRSGTRLGREAKRYMDRGALVPDHVVIGMIEERLDRPDAVRGVILDGFPRTVPQAEALDVSLTKRHKGVEAALYVGVGEQELLRRLSSRWVCRAAGHVYNAVSLPPKVPGVCDIDGSELYQREDDRPETVKARLAQQLPPMYEVVDYYTGRGILLAVDGEQAVADVTLALLRAIEHDPGRSSAA